MKNTFRILARHSFLLCFTNLVIHDYLCYMYENCSLFCGGAATPMIQDRLQFFISFIIITQTCVHVNIFSNMCSVFEDINIIYLFITISQSLPNYIIVKLITIFTFFKFKNPIKSILLIPSYSHFYTKYVRVGVRQTLTFPTNSPGIKIIKLSTFVKNINNP